MIHEPLFTRTSAPKPVSRFEDPKKRDLVKEATERYMYSRGVFAPHRRDWAKFFRAYAVDPWEPEDKLKLDNEGRPNAVFSYTTKVINAVVGLNMGDRKEHRFEAATTQPIDVAVANWDTRLVRHVMQKGGGPRVDSQVLTDLLITGYGWGHVYIDSTRRTNRIRPEHVDVWEMFPDPDAAAPGLTDAQWVCRLHSMDSDMAAMRWPQVRRLELGMADMPPGAAPAFPRQVSADGYDDEDSSDLNAEVSRKDGVVRVLEYQRKVYERMVTFDYQGVTQTVPEARFNQIVRDYKRSVDPETGLPQGPGFAGVLEHRVKIKRAWILLGGDDGNELLEDQDLPTETFTYVCATGLPQRQLYKGRTLYFGLMKLAYDPQLWASRAFSLLLEILGRTAKGGVYLEEDAVEDVEEFESAYARPGAVIPVKPGTNSNEKIRDRQPGQLPTAFQMLMQMGQQAVQETTGVTDATTGAMTSERSNVLVTNLQQQTLATLNPLTDGHTVYQMGMGQLCLQIVLKAMPETQVNRILGPQEIEGVTVQTDPATGEPMPIASPYQILLQQDIQELGIQIDTGAASPTERQRLWSVLADQGLLMKMMEVAPNEVREVLPDFIDLMPVAPEIGGKISAKLRQLLEAPTLEEVSNRLQQLGPEDKQQIFAMLQQEFAPPEEEQQAGGEQPPPEEQPVQ